MSCGILGAITGSEVAGLTGGAGFGMGAGAGIAEGATGTTEGTTGTYCWLCSNTRLGWVTGAAGATLRFILRQIRMVGCGEALGQHVCNTWRRLILFQFAFQSLLDFRSSLGIFAADMQWWRCRRRQ